MTTERLRQERTAAIYCETVYRYHYVCQDNTTFSAIASIEAGALCVLNAERPGIHAIYTDRTPVLWPPRVRRQWSGVPVLILLANERITHCAWCRTGFISTTGSLLCGKCREGQAANRHHAEGQA